MSLDARIPSDEEYLHIRVDGHNPLDTIRRRIAGASRRDTIVRILCETDLETNTEPLDVLKCVKDCSILTFPRYIRLSMVCSGESLSDRTFAEAIKQKHEGMNLGVFTDREEARAWLLKDS